MRRVLPWIGVAVGSAVVGWLFCFLSAIYAFRKYQPVIVDLEVPLEDEHE